jgi:hypothetical protein
MKPKNAPPAVEKLTLEQAIKALQAKAQNTTWTNRPDGSFSVSVPITPEDLKQMASLRARDDQAGSQWGQRKTRPRKPIPAPPTNQAADLLTEQMLAHRWHCSTSRLQRWRIDSRGPAYLKIGGKVLYRLADIRQYEADHVVKTQIKAC